jgi:hypothetical protein
MPPISQLAARVEAQARRPRVLIVLGLLVVLYGARQASRKMGDFEVYHRAAKRAVAGETTYRLSDPHRYLYAPVVTFLFFPIAVLPKTLGKVLWLALNFAAVASIVRTSAKLLFEDGRAPPGFTALVLLLSSRFIDNNIGHGQINLILLWLVLKAYALSREERYPAAGLALSAAIATKIVPVVFLVQIVLQRRWRFAAWTALAFAGLMLLPVVWWGAAYAEVVRDWVAVVVDQAGHYDIGNKINQSISAFVFRLFALGDGEGSAAASAVTLLIHGAFVLPLLGLSLWLGMRPADVSRQERGDELSLWLLYSTVAAPYSWKYYFANLMFPFASAVPRLWGPDHRRFEIVLGVVFALNTLAGLELPGETAERLLDAASLHFIGVVILFGLLGWEALKNGRPPRGEVASPPSP